MNDHHTDTAAGCAELGLEFKKNGEYEKAIHAFAAARLHLLAELGDCFSNLGRFEDASLLYEELLDQTPDSIRGMTGLGVAKLLGGKPGDAVRLFSGILKRMPNHPQALCGIGMAHMAEGTPAAAYDYLKRCLDIEPDNITALNEFIRCAYGVGRFDDAALFLEKHLITCQDDCDLRFSLAGLLYKGGRPAEAAGHLKRVLKQQPDYAGGVELLAQITALDAAGLAHRIPEAQRLKKEGRFEEALKEFNLIHEAGDSSVLGDMGDCMAHLGRFDEAEVLFIKLLSHDSKDVRGYLGQGVISLLKGNLKKSNDFFVRALQLDQHNSSAYSGLAMIRKEQGNISEAFDFYSRSLAHDPDNLETVHDLLKLAYEADMLELAEPFIEAYLMYHPADLHMLFSLAGLRYRIGRYGAARDTLEKIMTFDPSYEGAAELAAMISEALAGDDANPLLAAGA